MKTVSQALAAGESRVVAETQLWKDVSTLCRKAKIPLNKEAPDFVIMTTGAPVLDVIRIAEDPEAEQEQQAGMDGDPSSLLAQLNEAGEPTAGPEKKPAPPSKVAKGKKK